MDYNHCAIQAAMQAAISGGSPVPVAYIPEPGMAPRFHWAVEWQNGERSGISIVNRKDLNEAYPRIKWLRVDDAFLENYGDMIDSTMVPSDHRLHLEKELLALGVLADENKISG